MQSALKKVTLAAFYDGKKIANSPSVNDLTKYWLQLTYKY